MRRATSGRSMKSITTAVKMMPAAVAKMAFGNVATVELKTTPKING